LQSQNDTLLLEGGEKLLAGQLKHEVAPVAFWYLPASQAMQFWLATQACVHFRFELQSATGF